jgi:hypothetical protein
MCEVDFSDSDETWYSEKQRKARKAHRCSSCCGAILPGMRYIAHVSGGDGSITAEKMCAACLADRTVFAEAHHFAWCTPSYLPTLLAECIHDDDEESVRRWKPVLDAMKARYTLPAKVGGAG